MSTLTIIIVALGSIAGLLRLIWKKYWSKDAQEKKLLDQLEEFRREMAQSLRDDKKARYYFYAAARKRLLAELRDLRA